MNRVVFLVDMNAFFISCETTRRPELREIPAAVAGDPKTRSGIILTSNYKARAYGVRTTMTLFEAQKCCPNIVLIKPDYSFYSSMSHKVMDILKSYSPLIEQASIDEAWVDLSGLSRENNLPYKTAERIMGEIKEKLGLWCSIGISENKFLSKMASDMKKPLGITELWKEDIKEKLWPLPVSDMYGVGKSTSNRLKGIGIYTIGDIANYGEKILTKNLGKMGKHIYDLANGEDNAPLIPREKQDAKSIGRSTTLIEDTTDIKFSSHVLLALCEEIGEDARKLKKKGKTVQITIKYSDFSCITRQVSVPPTNLTKEIAEAGTALLKKNWTGRPVRLIGISISNFEGEEPEQLSFFETEQKTVNRREEKLEKTVDGIRECFGSKTIKRASLIGGFKNKKKD